MTKRLVLALVWGLLLIFILPAEAAADGDYRTVTLAVENMTCSMCPITVRKSLEKVEGVIDARADYRTHTATVIYDPSRTDIRALMEATTQAGYPSQAKADGGP